MTTKIYLWAFCFLIINCQLLIINSESIAQNVKPELVVQIGHSRGIYSVAFSPDGKYALSGSEDNTLKLWGYKFRQRSKDI